MLPMLVAFISVPIVLSKLGTQRFGVLTLSWTFIGYFSLFDLGMGRVITQIVSREVDGENEAKVIKVIENAIFVLCCLGILGTIIVTKLTPFIVSELLHIDSTLKIEVTRCFYIMALCIPIVIVSNVYSGILEAKQRFDCVNTVRIPLGVANFLIPLILVLFTQKTYWLVGLLAFARVIGLNRYVMYCKKVYPKMRMEYGFNYQLLKPLLTNGSWMTISNLIGPLMVTLDRFIIGSLISISAVTYYVTPYELATKMTVLVNPIVRVLFPAFSMNAGINDNYSHKLLDESVKIMAYMLFPLVLLIVIFSKTILDLWLGSDMANNCERVLQIISIGVYINIIGQLLFTYVQGIGRSDLTAKNHMLELPIYMIIIFVLVEKYGIQGAAVAWLLRVALDCTFLFYQAYSRIWTGNPKVKKMIVFFFVAVSFLLIQLFIHASLLISLVIYVFATAGFLGVFWKLYFDDDEKNMIIKLFAFIRSFISGGIRKCYHAVK
jgi:O-antigen/teichoic acid export membrane protein